MNKGKKIAIIGAGNVGATVAYTLTIDGMASEIVLIDVIREKAEGEAADILQGTAFCAPVNVYAGDVSDAASANIVIVTAGAPRKPGQSRIDLAQGNIDIIKELLPGVVKYAPDAVYIVVSNPVDVITYAILKLSGLPENQIIGSGTMLDTARLRSRLANHMGFNPKNMHGFVIGEHGDTAVVPWSLVTVCGMSMAVYCTHICDRHNNCGKIELNDIVNDVRTAGAKVIKAKGATYYAIALSVRRIVECVLNDYGSILTVSAMVHNRYGIDDVCLSLPYTVGAKGIIREITPPLTNEEITLLRHSADTLKGVIASLDI